MLAYVASRTARITPCAPGSAGRAGGNHDPSHGDRPGRQHTEPPPPAQARPGRHPRHRHPGGARDRAAPRSSPRSTARSSSMPCSRTSSTPRRSCSAPMPRGCGSSSRAASRSSSIASRDLGQELIDVVASVYEHEDVMGLRAMRERRPIVIADPAGGATVRPDLRAARVPDRQLRPAAVPGRARRPAGPLPPRPLRLVPRRARAVHLVRQPDGDGVRERPAVRDGPRGRRPAARDPGALVAPEPDPGRREDRRRDRGRGRPADPPRHDPGLQSSTR